MGITHPRTKKQLTRWTITHEIEPGIHTPDALLVRAVRTPASDYYPRCDFWFDIWGAQVLLPLRRHGEIKDAIELVKKLLESFPD